jgi:hypothetical protein
VERRILASFGLRPPHAGASNQSQADDHQDHNSKSSLHKYLLAWLNKIIPFCHVSYMMGIKSYILFDVLFSPYIHPLSFDEHGLEPFVKLRTLTLSKGLSMEAAFSYPALKPRTSRRRAEKHVTYSVVK